MFIHWLLLCFCAVIPGLAHARPLQVITFNAGLAEFPILPINAVACRVPRLIAQHRELAKHLRKPFVLMLQEIYHRSFPEYAAWAKAMSFYTTGTDPRNRGLMTISSEPIEEETFFPFEQNLWSQRRGLLITKIKANSKTTTFINVHPWFSNPGKTNPIQVAQLKQISALARLIGNKRAVLAGDFNAGADIPFHASEHDPVATIWEPFLEALPRHWLEAELPEGALTWDAENNPLIYKARLQMFMDRISIPLGWVDGSSTLDHIFVSPRIALAKQANLIFHRPVPIERCNSHDVAPGHGFLSDHYGVEITIE